jgi:hypothetical protein
LADRISGPQRGAERAIVTHRGDNTVMALPIFEFSAPDVPGCSVTIELRRRAFRSAGWKLGISTLTGGRTKYQELTTTAAFTANDGERKAVFVRVPATETYVFHLSDDPSVSSNEDYEYEILGPPRKQDQPAVMRHGRNSGAKLGEELAHYALRHNDGTSRYDYSYTSGRRTELGVGTSRRGTQVSGTASVELAGTLAVSAVLAGGYDYTLHQTEAGNGLAWRSSI